MAAYQPHVYYRQPGVDATDQGGVAFGPLGMAAGPDLRLTALARFKPTDNITVDIMQRWRDSMKLGGSSAEVWADNHLDAFGTTNVNLAYETQSLIGRTEFFLNVSNLFDAAPPPGAYSLRHPRGSSRRLCDGRRRAGPLFHPGVEDQILKRGRGNPGAGRSRSRPRLRRIRRRIR